MKFIRFTYKEKLYNGVLRNEEVHLLNEMNLSKKYENILDFIENYPEKDLEKVRNHEGFSFCTLEDITLLAPIEKTHHDIICVGLNYQEHIKEHNKHWKKDANIAPAATFFNKRGEVISGPGDEIYLDLELDPHLDYETELAVIIGKRGKNIGKESALEHIFGFTIINDYSSRQLQKAHGQYFKGKSLDGYTAIGPMIVTKDEFEHPLSLDIKTKINGEIRQNSNTKYMIRNISELIEELSRGLTLVPGDIIATGTPEGVGMGFQPPKYLIDGDKVESEIEGIGKLMNIITVLS